MQFHGDVILIDPAYAVRDYEDALKSRWGEDMTALGFSRFVYVNTVWEYMGRVYDIRTGYVLGIFGTESHALCALYYDELLAYNPDYFKEYVNSMHPEKNRCTCTILKHFSGEIQADSEKGCLIGTGTICFIAKLNQEEEDFSAALKRTGEKMSFSIYYEAKRKTPLTQQEIYAYEKIIAHHQKRYPFVKRNCEDFCVYETSELDIVFSGAIKLPASDSDTSVLYMAAEYWLKCLTQITEALPGCEWHVSFEEVSLIFDKHDGWRFPADEEYQQ